MTGGSGAKLVELSATDGTVQQAEKCSPSLSSPNWQENILVTNGGDVKLIDFGAAVDMCTGINFNPLSGMLDPRSGSPALVTCS